MLFDVLFFWEVADLFVLLDFMFCLRPAKICHGEIRVNVAVLPMLPAQREPRLSMQTQLLPFRSDPMSQVAQGGSLGPSTVQLLLSGATGLRQVTIDSHGIMFEVYDQGFMFSKICMASFVVCYCSLLLLFVVCLEP